MFKEAEKLGYLQYKDVLKDDIPSYQCSYQKKVFNKKDFLYAINLDLYRGGKMDLSYEVHTQLMLNDAPVNILFLAPPSIKDCEERISTIYSSIECEPTYADTK
jgi:hypothetical protein